VDPKTNTYNGTFGRKKNKKQGETDTVKEDNIERDKDLVNKLLKSEHVNEHDVPDGAVE